jgi:hypothetical protein
LNTQPKQRKQRIVDQAYLYSKSSVDAVTGCINWQGKKNHAGYGRTTYQGRFTLVHRVSWAVGNAQEMPVGLCVLHRCDNPSCINVDHLFVGTQEDNMKDMASKGRSCFGEKHYGARLTEAAVQLIKADTRSHSQIAQDHGVTREAISRIFQGRNWHHVICP